MVKETSPEYPKPPTDKSTAKTSKSKTASKKDSQFISATGLSSASFQSTTLKKESIAWQRVCKTVKKYHNTPPITVDNHPKWLVVGTSTADKVEEVIVSKPKGKQQELTYYVMNGTERKIIARSNVILYPRYATEGVDLINKPDKQAKEFSYLIWKDLCRLWPDDDLVAEQEQVLALALRTKQANNRTSSAPPIGVSPSRPLASLSYRDHMEDQDTHGFVSTNQSSSVFIESDSDSPGNSEKSNQKNQSFRPYVPKVSIADEEDPEMRRMTKEIIPKVMDDLIRLISNEKRRKGITPTETSRWKALQNLVSQSTDVDVEIVPVSYDKIRELKCIEVKHKDSSIIENIDNIIDEYLTEDFLSKALISESDSVDFGEDDKSAYESFCGRLSKDTPDIIKHISQWKAFQLVSLALAKELAHDKVDVLWLVWTFNETRRMSRQNFLSLAEAYHTRKLQLGEAEPLILEGLALAYYQIVGFFFDAIVEAEDKCNVFDSGHESELILEIADAKTKDDLHNLLRRFKKGTLAQFSKLFGSARGRAEETDHLVIRTWKTVDPDLKLLCDALQKHEIKPFGEVAAFLERSAMPDVL